MMDGIYSWIKNIAFFLILILAVQNIVPDNKYKKYIKIFSGVILILIIISPITDMFGVTDKISKLYDKKVIEQQLEEMQGNLSGMENEINDAAASQYNEYIKEQVADIVSGQGMYLDEFSCETKDEEDEVTIVSMNLTVSREDKSDEKIVIDKISIGTDKTGDATGESDSTSLQNIKNSIADFYNISDDNINISIR